MRRKVLALFLVVCMIMALVPTAALADATGNYSAGSFIHDSNAGSGENFKKAEGSDFPELAVRKANVSGNVAVNDTITVKRFPDPVTDGGKTYSNIGFVVQNSGSSISDGASVERFEGYTEKTYTIKQDDIDTAHRNMVYVLFIWEEIKSYTVTYDIKGTLTQGNADIYPVVKGFKEQGNHSSVAFFTIGNSGNGNIDLRYAGKDEYITDLLADGAIKQTCPQDGGTVAFPKLERLKTPDESGAHAQNKPYLEVVGFVARVPDSNGGYDYYELTGWKADSDSGVTGLYAPYDPSADTTLKAQWTKIDLSAESSASGNILMLKDDGTQTYLKLAQKTSGQDGFVTADTPTAADGVIDYQISMNLNSVFADRHMPWYATTYFKNIDDPGFAELHLTVKLDPNLELVTDNDGKTEITSVFNGFTIRSFKVGSQTITPETTHGTIKVDLNGAKEFTIDFEWNTGNGPDGTGAVEMTGMTVTIPTKVKDDATSTEITGTTATITGSFDFTKVHTEQNTHTDKAKFEADQFVRYYLSRNEDFFTAYGGEGMTLKDMLQAAKDIQEGLKNINETSNSVTATVSEHVNSLTLDQTSVTVVVNGTVTVQPIFEPDTVTNKAVTWEVEEGKETIVKVENGVITGLKPGTATVTCASVYDPSKTATVTVTVNGVVYVEPTTGGTVSVSGTGVEAITGTDNAYSVAGNATVTVAVTGTLAGETPSVYYYDAEGAKKPVTVFGTGTTFTFTMPAESPVYVSAAFVIQNGSGNTVVSESQTEVTDSTNKYTDSQKIDVEMSTQAVDEMLDAINKDGQGQKYNETALKAALDSAQITTGEQTIYRHIQTKADITVDKYPTSTGQGTGTIELNIKFQYRVVASTQADPDSLQVKDDLESSTSTVPNAVVVGDGWTEYESREDTYIVVPIPQHMGMPGDWIKATHTHTNANQTTTEYTHNLQVQNDQTVSYTNSHEGGYSPFTFEARRGVKDLRVENASEKVDIGTFDPDDKEYSGQVSIDVESINFTPDFMYSETGGGNRLNGTATLMVNGDEVFSVSSSGLPTYTVNLEEGDNTLIFTYVVGELVNQTYTITIYRGEKPTPPEEQPAEPSTTPTYPSFRPAPSTRFYDVDQTAWYVDAINYVVKNGLMNGVSETDFAPNDQTNRAMLVTILYRLDGKPAVTKNIPFSDVASGKWYSDAINWAAANEIVGGYGDGTFRPDRDLTREEAATILYRYATYKKYDVTTTAELTAYTDAASVQSYATAPMSWAVGTELINGTSATTLSPSGGAIRAQIATILMRFCENIVK